MVCNPQFQKPRTVQTAGMGVGGPGPSPPGRAYIISFVAIIAAIWVAHCFESQRIYEDERRRSGWLMLLRFLAVYTFGRVSISLINSV